MAWQELQAWTALAHLMAAHAEKANELHWLSESGRELESGARRPRLARAIGVRGSGTNIAPESYQYLSHIPVRLWTAHYCRFLEPITATDSFGGRVPGLAS